MFPLVSILIPLHNSEKYISAAILSALDQTYPNIEIIVVDDGSTDKGFQIACSFISSGVRILRQENKGVCATRNWAFQNSRGSYILFLDADDLLDKNKIAIQMNALQQPGNEQAVAFGRWKEFFNGIEDAVSNDLSIYKTYPRPLDLLTDMWCGGEMMSSGAWLSPRPVIEKAGPWNEGLHVNQDGEFFCRVLLSADAAIFTESVNYYRKGLIHSVSNSRFKPEKVESLLQSYLLYELVVDQYKNEVQVKRGLANNYYYFIYTYYHSFPELVKTARERVRRLGLKPVWGIYGGKNFRKISRWIGYYNTLRLRKLMCNLKWLER